MPGAPYAGPVAKVGAIGLVMHPARDCGPAVEQVTRWADARGVAVFGLAGERNGVPGLPALARHELAEAVDLLVSLGGDGTMLRTLRLSYQHEIPVLGVNLGKLGFLAEIDVPDLEAALCAISEDRFEVEPRVAVEAITGNGSHIAFNDIALVRMPGHGQAAIALTIDGQPFVRYVADAVVVSTPAGSTAYSFSAGGPLVSPRAEGLVVVPVAPHSAFNRALVLACAESLALELLASSGPLGLEADGQLARTLLPGERIELVTRVAAGSVIRLGGTTFYQRAQRKLRLADPGELG
jgi:NAD+ kinase